MGDATVLSFNRHEAANRAAKVAALAAAFEAHCHHAQADVPPAVVAGLAVAAPDRLWLDLAEASFLRKPSPTTIASTVRFLQIRAEQAGLDPFRGLA